MPTTTITTHYAPIGGSPHLDSSSSGSPSRVRTPDEDSENDGDEDEDVDGAYELRAFSRKNLAEGGSNTEVDPDGDDDSMEKEEEEKFTRRRRRASVQSPELYTPDERAVVRKLDRRLVGFLAGLYMLSFLDRSNIGNAAIAGLLVDLGLASSQYEWLLTSFYITYILFEWMTLLYRIVPAHIYISLCVCSWGLLASSQSLVTSFPTLLVLRALLGIGEAAFGPGVPFYLSFFFKREELATRTGLFISAAPLATSFASSLAWVIVRLSESSPIAPWRMLFLVEGFPSIIAAIFAWSLIPDSPGTARFLSRREKIIAELRLRKDRPRTAGEEKRGLRWREVLQALMDPICYLTALMFFSCNVAFSSMPVFLPTIIHEMGFSELTSQALAAPPYLLSFFSVLYTAYLSDRYRDRSLFICLHAILAFLGYTLIAIGGWYRWPIGWRYAGIYLATSGFFSAITIIITWTINNQDSDSKRGTGMAMLNIIGQCGPLLGTRLYPEEDGPFYVRGMAVCAGFMLVVFFVSVGLRVYLGRENRRRDRESEEGDREGLVGGEKGVKGFRFIL
ncbi:MAG: hypothetical protein M1839_006806 [Geoglossum umbratile]|nr:MAG: hypothetical protein M1839_006806 [Geoglossum umbratile]